jgi:UDP-N-acetylglucosamine 2-epimerase (non-hydrolysing)
MKVMTILGTRPEIIRLSVLIPLLDASVDHVLVHTGQNYDERLDAMFFQELGVRAPDENLGARGTTFTEQIGHILVGIEAALRRHRPDRILILGDTNSGLSSIVAARLGIPVYHMEAGNRCFDDRIPEEVNRRLIDHSSTVLLPYTNRSRDNLLREGIEHHRVYVTGNPIGQVLQVYADRISESTALTSHHIEPNAYFLVTLHRAENVDDESRLRQMIAALETLQASYGLPMICSFHPRTRAKFRQYGLDAETHGIRYVEPLGFFDFVRLERDAFCVLSDSGTVQEEACLLQVPNVTIRDVTERPETVECGSNFLAGADADVIARGVHLVTQTRKPWCVPGEYLMPNVAETVCRIVTSFRSSSLAEQQWHATRASHA